MEYREAKNKCFRVWGMRVDAVQIPEVIRIMEDWIKIKDPGKYIVISNVHDALISRNNVTARKSVNSSSLSVPDGTPLLWLARLYGYRLKEKVRGTTLFLEFLKLAEKKGYSNFFYGSTQNTLTLLIKNLKQRFPNLNISGVYSPPFRELSKEENEAIVEIINKASPDVLWVGLGCPKQQLWMYAHKDNKLGVPVMVGVGAAFDFVAHTKPQAPLWMRDNGLEWLFRLVTEPKRLWKRYLVGNTLFAGLFLKEYIKLKLLRKEA
jgi:N-acetylglucosaminyldiphosphoundecaprenol N-acetyl-beta-D-mannosaminyltransferase